MDKHSDDIDQVFKDRFEGYKDHSVDPSSQWSALEQGLSSGVGAGSSSAVGASSWAMAASFAAVVAIGISVQQDSSNMLEESAQSVAEVETASQTEDYGSDAASFLPAVEIQTTKSNQIDIAASERDQIELASHASDQKPNAMNAIEADSDGPSRLVTEGAVSGANVPSASRFSQLTNQDVNGSDVKQSVSMMEGLVLANSASEIIDRDPMERGEIEPSRIIRANHFYLRGAARIGNGESNTENNPNQWRANAVVSAGYEYHLSEKTFITFEAGYLRRTGYGVERSKNVDITPLVALVTSSYSGSESVDYSGLSFDIRESLVATRIDVIHMPLMMHVKLNHRASAGIGFYGEYLMAVRNNAYMVYDSQDYVETELEVGEASTKEGFSLFRAGLMGGYEHALTARLSADFRAMIPITALHDSGSDYTSFSTPNQLVDFQVGLKYDI